MCDNKQGISNEIIYDQAFTKKTVCLSKYQLQAMIDRALTVFNAEEMAQRLRNQANVMEDEIAREEHDQPDRIAWIPPLPARMIPRGFYIDDDGDFAPIPIAAGVAQPNDNDVGVEEIEGDADVDLVVDAAGLQVEYRAGAYGGGTTN